MGDVTALTRRTVVAAVPALGLVSQLRAWPAKALGRETEPVLRVTHVSSAEKAGELIEHLRRAPGCMKADAFAASDGRFTIFETWVSVNASMRFWVLEKAPAPALRRLEV